MSRYVVGTGGHIDHGKTALVRALTGEDTDRLPEEKARGISIDLGFSHLDLDDDVLGIVDVPGHEDFIRNMLAGASGIDVLLLVVAADEGVMPQTREHFAIAELLAVPSAVVALTKADLVEEEWLDLVRLDVAELLDGSRFEDAPVVPTSAKTGHGLDALRAALRDAGARPTRDPSDLFRLPIDRAFTVRGTGTVITGTVWSGSLTLEDEVRVLPDGSSARVRGLQVHRGVAERVVAGERAAVALGGVDREQVGRGATLVTDRAWRAISTLTVRLRVLSTTHWRIRQRQRVRVHLGTAEVMARVRLLEDGTAGAELAAGDEAWAQLRVETPLVARAGDRLVVRSYSPVTTIAGGRVAEAGDGKRKRLKPGDPELLTALADGPTDRAVDMLLREAGGRGVALEGLPLRIAAPPGRLSERLEEAGARQLGGRAFGAGVLEETAAALGAALDRHHDARPLDPGLELEELRRAAPRETAPALVEAALDRLREAGEVVVRDGIAAGASFRPRLTPEQERVREAVAEHVRAAGPEPPSREEIAAAVDGGEDLDALLRLLEIDGRILRIGPALYMDRNAAEALIHEVRERLGGRTGLGPADFRRVMPVSRKYLIPILEHLDSRGVTVRQGDGRAVPAGPRA